MDAEHPSIPPSLHDGIRAELLAMNGEYPLPDITSVIDTDASLSWMGKEANLPTPKQQLSSKEEMPKDKRTRRKQPSEATNTSPSKSRRQPKRQATTATNSDKKLNRHERSLERNRVAASKCRSRKKVWTERLEEKKSDLEAMRNELQTEYFNLLEESSQLKNHLIGHAGCQDPNIDVWINHEASKYALRLSVENPQLARDMGSLPSLDNVSALHSSTGSQHTQPSDISPPMDEEDEEDSSREDISDGDCKDEYSETQTE
ncbi:hypothetical protein QQS21_000483 [Conoideocrella luteorostrata]|uniref:BZIP domain-containing protein n=1 Tax=Conoideocrella luteorostrata TaxID=1105319 RepID=A0AAJ0CZV3_9HYPO|nr:hypothetical protein QQS21_000483 [Conoideocrella luteorostrata]